MASLYPIPKSKLGPPPSLTAKVRELAVQDSATNDKNSNVEQRILDRIKKCLQRANHPNTPEAEAKAAWRMASRLMVQYNVTQAGPYTLISASQTFAALLKRCLFNVRFTYGNTGQQ